MKLGIGSDHGGYLLKQEVIKYYQGKGMEIIDFGCDSLDSVDYPIYAKKVCNSLLNKEIDYGILICTTGIGMSITANKFKGVRAALVSNLEASSLTRRHNNSNVICIGAKYTSLNDAILYIDTFISTEFEGGRHLRRVNQIEENNENK